LFVPPKISGNSFDSVDPDTEKPTQGRSFNICVPLDSFRWNQIEEELRGWLDLKELVDKKK